MSFEILNKKKIKNILKAIESQWSAKPELDYVFLLSTKDKIYLSNRAIGEIDTSQLRINNIGVYFGEFKNNELRLSIEGSQLVGPHATKNTIELNDKQTRKWLRGEDVDLDDDRKAFVILKYKDDFLGCGRLVNKKVLNFVPKARRVEVII
jgi:NOL1/NOP2/fmu family ribosome biogenesis protein